MKEKQASGSLSGNLTAEYAKAVAEAGRRGFKSI
ncbi:hypothetical protein SEA_BOOPY_85 [Gordonia phage Boopy]|nr:hypothetical protein SEA_BOOPY_85 [Gordonia phage Boopy]UXE04306.1 hypothetical protein SEA_BLUENGOLD_84 [Gordonia phage BlueNGold]WBF03867.1 hypothetical protein SEA_MAREELIH_84 [Gordonia phage Mareelih]